MFEAIIGMQIFVALCAGLSNLSQREATEAKHWTFGYESIGQMFKADQEFVKCFHILGQFMTSERSPLAALMSSFESDAF